MFSWSMLPWGQMFYISLESPCQVRSHRSCIKCSISRSIVLFFIVNHVCSTLWPRHCLWSSTRSSRQALRAMKNALAVPRFFWVAGGALVQGASPGIDARGECNDLATVTRQTLKTN